MDRQGLFLCAKYAVSPNLLGYCGPPKTSSLIDHLKESLADKEISNILSDFEILYPYLQLIARQNKIADPFNQKVVEAYWLGNSLLKPVSAVEYQAFSKEKLMLDKKLPKTTTQKILTKISKRPFLPHHVFHVFNIFRRTGHDPGFHSLTTMDKCRIGWGQVKKVQGSRLKAQGFLIIETQLLTINNGQLNLGGKKLTQIRIDYKGKQFMEMENIKVGDWVSFHWGYLCDVLTEREVKNLEYYTIKAIEFYNR